MKGSWRNIEAASEGRVLSMYDEADDDFQTCEEISKDNPEVRLEELVLRSDSPPKMGHALFFAPEPIWMTPLLQWLTKSKLPIRSLPAP